jgi:hypothetical protein
MNKKEVKSYLRRTGKGFSTVRRHSRRANDRKKGFLLGAGVTGLVGTGITGAYLLGSRKGFKQAASVLRRSQNVSKKETAAILQALPTPAVNVRVTSPVINLPPSAPPAINLPPSPSPVPRVPVAPAAAKARRGKPRIITVNKGTPSTPTPNLQKVINEIPEVSTAPTPVAPTSAIEAIPSSPVISPPPKRTPRTPEGKTKVLSKELSELQERAGEIGNILQDPNITYGQRKALQAEAKKLEAKANQLFETLDENVPDIYRDSRGRIIRDVSGNPLQNPPRTSQKKGNVNYDQGFDKHLEIMDLTNISKDDKRKYSKLLSEASYRTDGVGVYRRLGRGLKSYVSDVPIHDRLKHTKLITAKEKASVIPLINDRSRNYRENVTRQINASRGNMIRKMQIYKDIVKKRKELGQLNNKDVFRWDRTLGNLELAAQKAKTPQAKESIELTQEAIKKQIATIEKEVGKGNTLSQREIAEKQAKLRKDIKELNKSLEQRLLEKQRKGQFSKYPINLIKDIELKSDSLVLFSAYKKQKHRSKPNVFTGNYRVPLP